MYREEEEKFEDKERRTKIRISQKRSELAVVANIVAICHAGHN